MANRYRGEIDAIFDGISRTLCLTLGALAELEAAFGAEDMLALATRFENGRIGATDCIRIIGAGLRGAGQQIDDAAVAKLQVDGGAAGFVDVVARLLAATFGSVEPAPAVTTVPVPQQSQSQSDPTQVVQSVAQSAFAELQGASREGRAKAIPFPGTT